MRIDTIILCDQTTEAGRSEWLYSQNRNNGRLGRIHSLSYVDRQKIKVINRGIELQNSAFKPLVVDTHN